MGRGVLNSRFGRYLILEYIRRSDDAYDIFTRSLRGTFTSHNMTIC